MGNCWCLLRKFSFRKHTYNINHFWKNAHNSSESQGVVHRNLSQRPSKRSHLRSYHYNDVKMSAMASQITSLTIVYSTVYSDTDQRKHGSSTSLALVQRIHRWSVHSPHKWPVTRKMFLFDDVIMKCVIHEYVLRVSFTSTSCEIALALFDLSKLVQVMAWFHQATIHYISHCWPSYACKISYKMTFVLSNLWWLISRVISSLIRSDNWN